ncbi:MAG: DNA cytosine methyltransferase, partial [Clostridia bacterium]
VAVRWAKKVRPRVIMMENVAEIQTWGPLLPNGKPDPEQVGKTYRQFIRALENLGYHVETNELVAADYGSPTTRRRWFMIARCDGKPIVWPSPTHLPRKDFGTMLEMAMQDAKPWKSVADVIDWSLPCPSIFDSKEEIKEKYGVSAVRPLHENTLKRIARGIQRFVLDNPEPFIVNCNHATERFRGQGIGEPLQTITAKHGYGVAAPVLMRNNENAIGSSPSDPLQTVTDGGHHRVIAPSLIQYHSEQKSGHVRGQIVNTPLMTVDASNRYALVLAFLHKYYGGGYTGAGSDLREPAPTVTAIDHNSLTCAYLTQFNNHCIGQMPMELLHTVTAGQGHFGEVRAFLLKYYGNEGYSKCEEPMPTQTTKDRFGLVKVYGAEYAIVDIGLRMLTPRELFDAQGFPHDYEIERGAEGRVMSKAEQVARCGNAVPPQLAEALVRANLPEMCIFAA